MTDPVASFSLPASSYTSDYDAHIYSLGMTWTPWRRLYFSSTFSWKDARTATFTRPDLSVSPYQGDVYSVLASSTWAATESTDLVMSYAFSLADFSQSNNEGNVPLGIEYQQHGAQIGLRRKFKSGVTTSLRYGLYLYDEASTGGENDYVAHAAFVSLSYRFP
jgi:hypothetical protein